MAVRECSLMYGVNIKIVVSFISWVGLVEVLLWLYYFQTNNKGGFCMARPKDLNLLTVGYYKGEIDFSVNCYVQKMSMEELNELRTMVPVAIWALENMWRDANRPEAGQIKEA